VSKEKRRYISFLLRLWQTESKGDLVWRASLESSGTEERWGFASLDELFAFLRQQTAGTSDSSAGKGEARRQNERRQE
jgi:hypothetical protein